MKELIPLFLLKSAGGKIEGTTRFQKLVFLAQNEPNLPLSEDYQYEYYPYKYGPFSKELAEDLDDLEARELIRSGKVHTPAGDRHIYRLTEDGEEELNQLESRIRAHFQRSTGSEELAHQSLNEIANVEDVFNNMPLSNLLEYVYNHYEDLTEKSELDIA